MKSTKTSQGFQIWYLGPYHVSFLCYCSVYFLGFFGSATWHQAQGIEPVPPAVEVWSLNHWMDREVPHINLINEASKGHH